METADIARPFFTSTLDWGEWAASRHGRFNAGKERLYQLDRELSRPQNMSERYREEKNLAFAENGNPVVLFVARRSTDWANPAVLNYLHISWNSCHAVEIRPFCVFFWNLRFLRWRLWNTLISNCLSTYPRNLLPLYFALKIEAALYLISLLINIISIYIY
jgi:hypothetical protein